MIKKHMLKVMVFVTNLAMAGLGLCFIKNEAEKKAALNAEEKIELIPINQEISSVQEKIALDREQKLRNLNTQPKATKKIEATTTTTTTTEDKSTTKTKTS
jgi:hypothetical protein